MIEKIHSTPSFDGILQKNGFSTHNNTIASYECIKNIKNMMQRMVEKSCVFSIRICGIVLLA